MLHRVVYIGSSTSPFAVGSVDRSMNSSCAGYSVLWGSAPNPLSVEEIVAHPAPGQRLEFLTGSPERPHVERAPDYYDRPRGYPVSVSFGRLPFSEVDLRVFVDGEREPLPGELFTPERPIHSTRPSNANTVFFSPKDPLKQSTTYRAEFQVTHEGELVRRVWFFST